MDKVLLVTPIWPPTAGGPATHAKKLFDYFNLTLVNFEKYKHFPSGIRHFLVFVEIFFKSFSKKYIYALDGFSVALPSIMAGKFLNKKVVLRIGGDFVYEQFLYTKEIDLENFYNNFYFYKKSFSSRFYFKYLIQKYILEKADVIIFNTAWQKNIYQKHYKLTKNLFVITNPIETIDQKSFEKENYENNHKYIFTSITRDIPYKNLHRLKKVFLNLKNQGNDVLLETHQSSWANCLKRISKSRAYICASISDISPNQVYEAIALKVPIIISKYTGITNVIKEKEIGIIIDPFDEKSIEQAVMDMCNDNNWQMYKNNLEKLNFEKSWALYFEETEKVF